MTTQTEALKLAVEEIKRVKAICLREAGIGLCNEVVIAKLEEALAQPEQETQAYREAAQLAKWLFKTHYAQEEHYASGRVVWGLCDTTAGVISQIDNMVCKLVLPKEPEQEPFGYLLDGVFYEVMQFHFQGGAWEGQIPVYTTPPQRKPLTDAALHLSNLVDALDNAFISSWQSTHHWQKQLDDAREYLAAHGIKENQ